jgi:hypothetical protein
VREFAREDERKLAIVFDNPEPGVISERAYEKAVDLAASLAWHFTAQQAEVSFLIPGRARSRDLHEFLQWLAVVEPCAEVLTADAGKTASSADKLAELGLGNSGEYNIVVTTRSRGSLPSRLWNSSYFVFVGE